MTDPQAIADGLSEAQRRAVKTLPMVAGKRNGVFWASDDGDMLADLSRLGLCKMPFADNVGVCNWQYVARLKTGALSVRAILAKEEK